MEEEFASYLCKNDITSFHFLFVFFSLVSGTSQDHFEEQQYADLSEFQENHYGALDTKLALCHDYAYIDQAKIRELLKKKDSVISMTGYECIDAKTPLNSGNYD